MDHNKAKFIGVEYEARQFSKEKFFLASRYTHDVTTNQIYRRAKLF